MTRGGIGVGGGSDDPDYADLAEQRTKYRLYLSRKQLFKARPRVDAQGLGVAALLGEPASEAWAARASERPPARRGAGGGRAKGRRRRSMSARTRGARRPESPRVTMAPTLTGLRGRHFNWAPAGGEPAAAKGRQSRCSGHAIAGRLPPRAAGPRWRRSP